MSILDWGLKSAWYEKPLKDFNCLLPVLLSIMEVRDNKMSEGKFLSEVTFNSKKQPLNRWRIYINSFTLFMLALIVVSTLLVEQHAAQGRVKENIDHQKALAGNDKSESESLLLKLFSSISKSNQE